MGNLGEEAVALPARVQAHALLIVIYEYNFSLHEYVHCTRLAIYCSQTDISSAQRDAPYDAPLLLSHLGDEYEHACLSTVELSLMKLKRVR